MPSHIDLETLLSQAGDKREQLASFSLLCLGIIESLANGVISAGRAIPLFFHADNCLFVEKHLQDGVADEVMSHGVQLPDLYDALSAEQAQQEFQRELAAMHSLCLKLITDERAAA